VINKIKVNIAKYLLCIVVVILITTKIIMAAGQLNIQSKNFSDDLNANGLTFDTFYPTETYKVSNQYLEVIYVSSRPLWQIDIYTDNNTAQTGYQKGGLLNTNDITSRLPLAWKIFNSTPVAISTGNPDTEGSGWYWLKDKNDVDDPTTGSNNESWASAQMLPYSYTCIVYGGLDYSKLSDGTPCSSPVYIAIEGILDGVAGGAVYSSTVWFDLCYITDIYVPDISHTPIEKVGIVGNNIKFEATVTDDKNVSYVKLYYKIDSGAWQIKEMTMQGHTAYNKDCYTTIGVNEIPTSCSIRYYIEAYDGVNLKLWKKKDDPQLIQISQTSEFTNILNGTISVEDGNPDDGEVSLIIPVGALEKAVNIEITQRNLEDADIYDGNGAAATKKPVAVYELKPDGLSFKKPVTLTLLYFDLNNNGKVEYQNGSETQTDETILGLFWWDNFDWRLIGSNIDKDKNTVTGQITHFSIYGIFPVKELSADDYRPKEKIITPATKDNINDFATFDGLYSEYEIKIYDINGIKVKTINECNDKGPMWDGTDENGNIVESGVYIYQFKALVEDKLKLVSGTIAVAK